MPKQISFLIITALIISVVTNSNVAIAAEPIQAGFNPNKLIDDKVFSNYKSMSVADIQKFLEEKGSILANTSNSFVSQFREPVGNTAIKELLEDPNTGNTIPRTAAELIYDASLSSGLNPQVILVKLNKEQSLITGRRNSTPEQLQRALDFSLGFGCPDTQPCGAIYKGFYFQLFGGVDSENNRYLGAAKSLMKSYSTPGGRGPWYNGATSKVGDTITLGNTMGDYEGVQANQTITLSNSATAALYRYTPHVYNGNYNFWRFFKMWFGSPNSGSDTPTTTSSNLVKTSSTGDVYLIENNVKYKVVPFAAKLGKIKLSDAKRVSKSVLSGYQNGGLYRITDNSLIKVSDTYYVFLANQRRLITEEQIKTAGLNIRNAVKVSAADSTIYTEGSAYTSVNTPTTPAPTTPPTPAPTTPASELSEGAVIKTASKPDVYLLSGGKLKLFTYATFVQYNAVANLKIVTDADLAKYIKEGLVLPKDGTLVKAFDSQTVFFYEEGKKKPMDGEIFRNRGWSYANVFELTKEVIDALPLGPFPLPKDNTYFNDKKTNQLYWYTEGKKRAISSFVAKQKNITPDFAFGEDTINNLPNGVPVFPREGTVIKSNTKADVYIINANLAFPMTFEAYKARGITEAQVNIITQSELDSYPKGSLLTK